MEEEDSLTMSTYEILPPALVQLQTIPEIIETMTSTEIKAEIMNSDDIWQCVTKPPKPAYPAPIPTTESVLEPTESVLEPTESVLELTEAVLELTESVLEPTESVLEPTESVLEPSRDPLSSDPLSSSSILSVQVDLMEEFQQSSGIGTIGFFNLPETLKHAIEIIERLNWQDSGATKKYFVVQLLLNLVKTSEENPSENDKAFHNFISAGHVDGLIDLILAASKGRLRVNQQPLTLFQRFIARCCCFFRRENYTVNK